MWCIKFHFRIANFFAYANSWKQSSSSYDFNKIVTTIIFGKCFIIHLRKLRILLRFRYTSYLHTYTWSKIILWNTFTLLQIFVLSFLLKIVFPHGTFLDGNRCEKDFRVQLIMRLYILHNTECYYSSFANK